MEENYSSQSVGHFMYLPPVLCIVKYSTTTLTLASEPQRVTHVHAVPRNN